MAITGYRPPTATEVENYRKANNLPAGLSTATLPDGSVIFYDYGSVVQLYPSYRDLNEDQKRYFLSTIPGGTILKVPLQPIIVPDAPSTPSAPVPTPTSPSNPVSVSPVVSPIVNLASLLAISKASVDRTYVKNSMMTLDPEVITLTNSSDSITIDVQLNGAAGVIFTPNIIHLGPRQTANVTVSFNSALMNNLPEGTATLASTISLSSTSIIDTVETPVVQDRPPILEEVPTIPAPENPITPPWEIIDKTPWIPVDLPRIPPIDFPPIPDAPPIPDFPVIPVDPPIQDPIPDAPPQSIPPVLVEDPTAQPDPFDGSITPPDGGFRGGGNFDGNGGSGGGGGGGGELDDSGFRNFFEI